MLYYVHDYFIMHANILRFNAQESQSANPIDVTTEGGLERGAARSLDHEFGVFYQ